MTTIKKIREKIYIKNFVDSYKIAGINVKKFKGLVNIDGNDYIVRLSGSEIPIFLEYAIIHFDGDVLKGKEFYNNFLEIVRKMQDGKKSMFVIYKKKNKKNKQKNTNTENVNKKINKEEINNNKDE